MQWFGGRESDNVEDGGSSGGGKGLALGGGVLGVIGFLFYLFTGVNPSQIVNQNGGGDSQPGQTTQYTGPQSMQRRFVRTVLGGTEDVWDSLFRANGQTYEKPKLVLFSEGVNAGCGFASSATGPFYCPADRKVYLDTAFFNELQTRFQAPGLAAEAYVIAHEVGHHVQNLLGVSAKMDQARSSMSQTDYNKLSVKLELQADFYAGVWAHYEQNSNGKGIVIRRSDIDSVLNAAHAIGDDRLQKQATGHVSPDSFTHGTSEQRAYWFKRGFDTGDMKKGDTFGSGE
jgi:predicted metalloprotease